jgi:hypothetical protein
MNKSEERKVTPELGNTYEVSFGLKVEAFEVSPCEINAFLCYLMDLVGTRSKGVLGLPFLCSGCCCNCNFPFPLSLAL